MSRSVLRRAGAATTAGLLALTLAGPAGATPSGMRPLLDRDEVAVTAAADGARDLASACPDGRVPASGFRDTAGSVFAPAIDCLVWYEVTTGRTATTYDPGALVNRRQMAVFVHRTLDATYGTPEYGGFSRFTDVPDAGFGSPEINVLASADLAEELGRRIVTGKTPTTYDPTSPVTRAQMASFVDRTLAGIDHAFGLDLDVDPCRTCFPDRDTIPQVHRGAVERLAALGVVEGRRDGSFDPSAPVTRGQMAAFLTRAIDVLAEVGAVAPPDFFVPLVVDRDRCVPARADGSQDAPFCTIQAGVDAARAYPDRYVAVIVEGDETTTYREDVVVDPAATFALSLWGSDFAADDGWDEDLWGRDEFPLRELEGSITVTGGVDGFVDLAAFAVTSPDVAVTVEGDVNVSLGEVTLEARTALAITGDGSVDLFGAGLVAEERAVDITGAAWFSAFVTDFGTVGDAYVVLPSGAPDADERFAELVEDDWTENTFATATEQARRDGDRPALVPVVAAPTD